MKFVFINHNFYREHFAYSSQVVLPPMTSQRFVLLLTCTFWFQYFFQDESNFIYLLLQVGSGEKKKLGPDPADQKSPDTPYCVWDYALLVLLLFTIVAIGHGLLKKFWPFWY